MHIGGLDIAALNNERKKMNGARKVIIYILEDVYLRTKWAMMDINHNWIEIKRTISREIKDAHNFRSNTSFRYSWS